MAGSHVTALEGQVGRDKHPSGYLGVKAGGGTWRKLQRDLSRKKFCFVLFFNRRDLGMFKFFITFLLLLLHVSYIQKTKIPVSFV